MPGLRLLCLMIDGLGLHTMKGTLPVLNSAKNAGPTARVSGNLSTSNDPLMTEEDWGGVVKGGICMQRT